MLLDAESWMNIRRFRALHDAGASYGEIARYALRPLQLLEII